MNILRVIKRVLEEDPDWWNQASRIDMADFLVRTDTVKESHYCDGQDIGLILDALSTAGIGSFKSRSDVLCIINRNKGIGSSDCHTFS